MHIQDRLPRRIQKGISFVHNTYFRFFRIKPFAYASMSPQEKMAAWHRRAQFFATIQKPNLVAQMWVIAKERDWKREMGEMVKKAHPEALAAAERMAQAWLSLIERSSKPIYDWILALEIPIEDQDLENRNLREVILATHRDLMEFLGFERRAKDYLPSEIEKIMSKAQKITEESPSWILEPMESWEVYDFYRYHYNRGFSIPPLPDVYKEEEHWPADNSEYVPDAAMEEREGYIILRKPGQERYVACVVPALLPPLKPPRHRPVYEIVYRMITELEFPVDFTMHWIHTSREDSMKFVMDQANDVLDKVKAIIKVHREDAERKGGQEVDLPEFDLTQQEQQLEIVQRYGEIRTMHQYLKENDSPTLEAHMMFVVSAHTEKQLEQRIKAVKEKLKELDVLAEVPTRDQRALFESWYPAQQWEGFGYKKRLIPEYASMFTMPGAAELIGNETGFPFALNEFSQPVMVSLMASILSDRNGSWFISGDQGSGKTHLLNMLAVIGVVYEQARATIWDLKPEDNRMQWIRDEAKHHPGLPGIGHLVDRMPLDGNQCPGALDMFRLIPDEHQAREAVVAMIDQLLPKDDQSFERQLVIMEAVGKLTKSAGMADLIQELKTSANPVGRRIGEYLEYCGQYPLGKLLFGRGNGEMRIPDTGIILIQPEGLELPENREPENLREKLSLAVLNNLALWNQNYLFHYQGLGLGIYDEGWSFFGRYSGRIISERQSRLGRSKKTGLLFASQSALDIPPDLMGLIGTYVCLGTTTDEETERAMQYLGVAPDNDWVRKDLRDLSADRPEEGGERSYSVGYMRDYRGRTAKIYIVTPDEELRRAFNTRPDRQVQQSMEVAR